MTKSPTKAPGPDDYKTELDKATKRDPVTKPVQPEPVEVMDLAPNEPYPTGSPPERNWAEINGFGKDAVR